MDGSPSGMITGSSDYVRPCHWTLDPASHPAPLLVVLHGYRQDRDFALQAWEALRGDVHLLAVEGPCVHEFARPRRIGYAWYVYNGDRDKLRDEMVLTSRALDRVIAEVSRHIDLTDLWLAGFSQGAYMALYYALAENPGVSCVQSVAGNFNAHRAFENLSGKKVFLQHGNEDPGCPVERMGQLESLLCLKGAHVERKLYSCRHELLPEMVEVWQPLIKN